MQLDEKPQEEAIKEEQSKERKKETITIEEEGTVEDEQSKTATVEVKSTLTSSRSKSKLEKEKLIKNLVTEEVPRESKIMLLKILQNLSEFLFLIENDKTQGIGLENYQAAGRVKNNENELEDLY